MKILLLIITLITINLTNSSTLWTKLIGTDKTEQGYSITTDSNNNVYLSFFTNGNFDGNLNVGGVNSFLNKFDATGNKIWTKLIATQYSNVTSVTADSNNNIYVVGITSAPSLDGNTNAGGQCDSFVFKFDSLGNKLWTRMIGTNGTDLAVSTTTDSNNNVYVVGGTNGNLDGNTNNGGEGDAFFVKFDSSGNKLWTKLVGSISGEMPYSVTTDLNKNVYITGVTDGNLDGYKNAGEYDVFVTKLDSLGNRIWTKLLGSNRTDVSNSVTTDSNNNIYVTGWTNGELDGNKNDGGNSDIYLTKFDSSGTKLWTKQYGTSKNEEGASVRTDSNNNVYVAGWSEGNLDGNTNLGRWDAFLSKFDSLGNRNWTKLIGTNSTDEASVVVKDTNDYILVAGTTKGDLDGNKNSGFAHIFVTKMDKNCIPYTKDNVTNCLSGSMSCHNIPLWLLILYLLLIIKNN